MTETETPGFDASKILVSVRCALDVPGERPLTQEFIDIFISYIEPKCRLIPDVVGPEIMGAPARLIHLLTAARSVLSAVRRAMPGELDGEFARLGEMVDNRPMPTEMKESILSDIDSYLEDIATAHAEYSALQSSDPAAFLSEEAALLAEAGYTPEMLREMHDGTLTVARLISRDPEIVLDAIGISM